MKLFWPLFIFLLIVHLLAASMHLPGAPNGLEDAEASKKVNEVFIMTIVHMSMMAMLIRSVREMTPGIVMNTIVFALFMFGLTGSLIGLLSGLIVGAIVFKIFNMESKTFGNTMMVQYVIFFLLFGNVQGMKLYEVFSLSFVTSFLRDYWYFFLFVPAVVHLITNGLPELSLPKQRKEESGKDEEDEDEDMTPHVQSRSQKRKQQAKNNGVFNRFSKGLFEKLERLSRS